MNRLSNTGAAGTVSRIVASSVVTWLLACWILCQVTVAGEVPPRAKKLAGVTLLKRDKCDSSYRLYSSRGSEAAHIIDLDGRKVHSWSYPQGHTWHYAETLPNGHLVAIIKDVMILELDWRSKLVWSAKLRAHHDFVPAQRQHARCVPADPAQSVDRFRQA